MIFSWYVSAMFSIVLWGFADLFYKKGTDSNDRFSHLRIVFMVGLVMGIQALFELYKMDFNYNPINMVKYLPVSFLYILSMTLGYVGLRYLDVSISSPVGNTSGAIAGILAFLVLGKTMNLVQLLAVTGITIGLVGIGIVERDMALAEIKEKRQVKHKLGAMALIFPILYAIVDALGTFMDDVYLSKLMSPEEALISYEATFFIVGLLALAYIIFIKKEKFMVFKEKDKLFAALFETAGQFFYVYALDTNSVVVAPMIASYSIVSVILGRIFLKEALTKKQYLAIGIVMLGVIILGFFE